MITIPKKFSISLIFPEIKALNSNVLDHSVNALMILCSLMGPYKAENIIKSKNANSQEKEEILVEDKSP